MFNDKTFTFRGASGFSYDVRLVRGFYGNGNKALQLVDADDGSPVLIATVNLGARNLPGFITVKDYSENEGVLEFLQEIGFVADVDHYEDSGYVTVPVCRLTPEGEKFFE